MSKTAGRYFALAIICAILVCMAIGHALTVAGN